MNGSPYTRDLGNLADQLRRMTATAVGDTSIETPDLMDVILFIERVVQVVRQAFEDVYAVLLQVRFFDPSAGLTAPKRLRKIKHSLAMVTVRSRYRDAEEICSRLHHLGQEYDRTIGPIVSGTAASQEWPHIFYLLDEYEGRIINMVQAAVYDVQALLEREPTESNLRESSAIARDRAEEIKAALSKLQELQTAILGSSGQEGLLELITVSDRGGLAAALTVGEIRVGDTYNTTGAGAVGRGATASSFTINTWDRLENKDTAALAGELAALRAALKERATNPEHDLAVGEVGMAQVAAEKGDGPTVMEHLGRAGQWTFGIATSIGTALAGAAIKTALGI